MNAPVPSHVLPAYAQRPVPAAMLAALQQRFGERCSTSAAVREQHGRDESPYPTTPPEAVVFCHSSDDVVAVLRLAHDHAVPVIPFGTGSSHVQVHARELLRAALSGTDGGQQGARAEGGTGGEELASLRHVSSFLLRPPA